MDCGKCGSQTTNRAESPRHEVTTTPRMLDLFAGLGGASAAMKDRGWDVIRVEINPEFKPDICQDITKFIGFGDYYDLVWASPPCTEFTKASMPPSWNKNRTVNPDTGLLKQTLRVMGEIKPRYWIIENVRGAVPFFSPIIGEPVKKVGSRYLWGVFPDFKCAPEYGKWRLPPSKDRAAKRSLIPYSISLAVALAIERELNASNQPRH